MLTRYVDDDNGLAGG